MPPKSKTRRGTTADAASDTPMEDAPPSGQGEPAGASDEQQVEEQMEGNMEDELPEEEEVEEQRVKVLPGSSATAASFEFLHEGHTLGNALRFIIMKNPDVEFCAYAIPHPSEAKMNLRIQTYDGTAVEALEKGLRDLQDLCDVVAETYSAARLDFVNEMET